MFDTIIVGAGPAGGSAALHLTKEGQRQEKLVRRIEETLDSLLRQAISRLPDRAPFVLIIIVITITLFIIFMVLESGA